MRDFQCSACRLRCSVSPVWRGSDLRPPTFHHSQLSLLPLAVLLGLCGLRHAGWPAFQAPQGMGLQKVFELLGWRRLWTLRDHDVPSVECRRLQHKSLNKRSTPRRSASIIYLAAAVVGGDMAAAPRRGMLHSCGAAALSEGCVRGSISISIWRKSSSPCHRAGTA